MLKLHKHSVSSMGSFTCYRDFEKKKIIKSLGKDKKKVCKNWFHMLAFQYRHTHENFLAKIKLSTVEKKLEARTKLLEKKKIL